ncbi:hypothetical protein BSKO_05155 [Bryopsis sp. KO-2023]|nr:hypothetical protein BSKO_05155 [Bryopsis sp. KO-2023]
MSGSDMGSLKISRSTFNRNKVVKRQAVPMQSGPHVKSEVDDGEQKGSFLGGALFLLKIPDISIEDCMFTGNRAAATGGAISILAPGVDASDAKIVGCTFDGNSAAGDSNATTLGGGLYISGGVLRASIKDSNFTKNGANTSGGALYGRKFSSLKISHSLFFENRVVKDDGKSFGDSVNGTRYLGGVDIAVGGAILLTDVSETFIVKSSFARNKAQDGGGIYAANFGGSLLKIERTVFSSNEANEGGGAMSAVRTKYLISGSIFWKNTAGYGGAVEGSSVAVDISQCSFKNNTSIDNGGGMYLWVGDAATALLISKKKQICLAIELEQETSTLLVESTKFTENVAMHSDGGALGLMSTNATISKSNFTGNVGYGQGGAIHSAHVKWQQAPFLDGFDESSFPEAILPETERNRLADLLVNAMRDKLEARPV